MQLRIDISRRRESSGPNKLRLTNVSGIFILWIFGNVCAAITLTIEIWRHRVAMRRPRVSVIKPFVL